MIPKVDFDSHKFGMYTMWKTFLTRQFAKLCDFIQNINAVWTSNSGSVIEGEKMVNYKTYFLLNGHRNVSKKGYNLYFISPLSKQGT